MEMPEGWKKVAKFANGLGVEYYQSGMPQNLLIGAELMKEMAEALQVYEFEGDMQVMTKPTHDSAEVSSKNIAADVLRKFRGWK